MVTTFELIAKLERDLAALRRIPERQRDAELADIREEICQSMLTDLRSSRHFEPSVGAGHVRR